MRKGFSAILIVLIILTLLLVGLIIIFRYWQPPQQVTKSLLDKHLEEVVGSTNKNTYYQHMDLDAIEYINVSLKNNLKVSIFSDGITNIEKKSQDGNWEKLPRESCVPPDCIDDFRIPAEIKPGESKVVDGISVDILEPSTYRFEIGYYFERNTLQHDQSQKTILSNEFTVNPELARAKFTKKFSEETIDTNNNGLYDFLIINVEINVATPGKYYIYGYLNGGYERSPLLMLEKGLHSIPLKFDGQSIRYTEENGPYRLQDLYIQTEDDDNTSDIIFLELNNEGKYQTKPYKYIEFEPLFSD